MQSAPYGFSDRFPSAFPSQIVVDVTERCNLACDHCSHSEFAKSPLCAGRDMSEDIHEKMLREVAEDGKGHIRYIRYTAVGEPLLHPRIYDFLDQAAKKAGCPVALTTNGTLLDKAAAKRILDSGISIIDISIDAFTPETYSRIRKGGSRDRVYENTLALIAMRDAVKSPLKIVTTFIDQPLNEGEAEAFRDFWLSHGADDVIIRRLHSDGGAKLDIAAKLLENCPPARKPCLYLWERISLDARGMLRFCPDKWDDSSDCGDFSQISIKDAWSGAYMDSIRKQHLDNAITCSACKDCPDWMQTRWPHEGRSYADMVSDFTAGRK